MSFKPTIHDVANDEYTLDHDDNTLHHDDHALDHDEELEEDFKTEFLYDDAMNSEVSESRITDVMIQIGRIVCMN